MKNNKVPFYQTGIQSLPLARHTAAQAISFLFGHRIKAVVNHANMTLDLREGIQRQMFLGVYEPTETEWLRQCLNPGDTFIDVGANFGHYTTLAAALVRPTGTVFAFEPSPVANRVLEEAILASNIANIVLTKAAVGKTNGTVPLFLPTTRSLHSPSVLRSDPHFLEVQVPVVALDHFEPLTPSPQIKLMKIDVEGYEPDVLRGAEQLIKGKRIENIFCEFNSWWLGRNSTTSQQLLQFFMDLGYRIHDQTKLQENLLGHDGATFDLQDIWFQLAELEH
jgi:FkbM family methyltransferase